MTQIRNYPRQNGPSFTQIPQYDPLSSKFISQMPGSFRYPLEDFSGDEPTSKILSFS